MKPVNKSGLRNTLRAGNIGLLARCLKTIQILQTSQRDTHIVYTIEISAILQE